MGSLTTKACIYNKMADGRNQRGKHMVSGFVAAKKSTKAPNDDDDGTADPETKGSEENAAAALPRNSTGEIPWGFLHQPAR